MKQKPTGVKAPKAQGKVRAKKVLTAGEVDALARVADNDAHSLGLFVTTRTTLLRRVNAGDHKAFEEFYNIYAPAMLKYLGLVDGSKTERNQLDVVQTVFAKFYKAFALTEDPNTGKKRVPRSIFAVLNGTNKKTGKSYSIKFRQYLLTCLKNAVRTVWRDETKHGTVSVVSLDARVKPEEEATWKDKLAACGVDPKVLDCAAEEGERLSAVWDIWHAVVKAISLDDERDDAKRDIIYKSLAEGASAEKLAEKWGVTKGSVYTIKSRAIDLVNDVTRAVFKMLGDEDVEIDEAAAQLYRTVASMKPGKRRGRIDKFMIGLAEELLAGRK